MKKLAWWLVVIGALNWGLVGIGYFFSPMSNWNLVEIIFKGGVLAHIIYILVGISAVVVCMGCKSCKSGACKACANGTCDTHRKEGGSM